MRPNGVREAWAAGRAALGAWLMVPSAFSAEIIAHAGFDWVCVDMQHGIIGKALDAGARGVIIPMVNRVDDAERAVAACRYAPAGARSYGPVRANYYAGFDYFAHANDDVLCIVMIETKGAVADVDNILSVPGIDAVYVGPADLSVTLGLPPAPDQDATSFTDAITRIVDACHAHGVVPGIAGNQKTAPKRIEQGFRLVEVAADAAVLAAGMNQALQAVAPDRAGETKSSYL